MNQLPPANDALQSLCLHERFALQASATPDRIALRFDGDETSYAELEARANQIAHRLVERDVCPDDRVAFEADRSADCVVSLLAIAKAGGAYAPLDPSYPEERLRFLLEDTRPRLVLTTGELGESGVIDAATDSGVDCLAIDHAEIETAPRTAPVTDIRPDHLAYVIHTSGSTGRPKGVMVEHRQVTRLFDATRAIFDFGSRDVWTLFHSLAFDFSVWETWGALLHGGTLVGVSQEMSRDPRAFLELLEREQVTMLSQTPSAFSGLVEADSRTQARAKLALRWIVFGGEALDVTRLAPWFDRRGNRTRLSNMYGITETTVHVTHNEVTSACPDPTGQSVIGRPLSDMAIELRDEYGAPVRRGEPGEIHVRGAGVARGYLGRPALTRERFGDTNTEVEDVRIYRSGDLAVERSDGSYLYLGRIDDQIQLRGHRVEPGEIESALREHPEIAEAVVLAKRRRNGTPSLHAFVVSRSTSTNTGNHRSRYARAIASPPREPLTQDELRESLEQYLRKRLPAYLIPNSIALLPTLPLSANGKIDRNALLAETHPNALSDERGNENGRPALDEANDVALQIARLYEEVLEAEGVRPSDDFFELGGDSIAVVVLFALIEEQLSTGLALDVLAQGATPEALSHAIEAARAEAA